MTRPADVDWTERALRDQLAYDEDEVDRKNQAWMLRVMHVFEGANTLAGEKLFRDLTLDYAAGRRVLEIGCGTGEFTQIMLDSGAASVLAVDVSERLLATASCRVVDERVGFCRHDVQQPLDGHFDLIYGRSILHHIEFREFLSRAYRDNLEPGGRMAFMEPMSHPMTLAFHLLVRSAHTPDERPIYPRDLEWMQRAFPNVRCYPINLVSFPAGVVSSLLLRSADNQLMRLADRLDRTLASRAAFRALGRQGIIVIDKPPLSD